MERKKDYNVASERYLGPDLKNRCVFVCTVTAQT